MAKKDRLVTTPEEFAAMMKKLLDKSNASVTSDGPECHAQADRLVSAVLRELGYDAGVEHYFSMEKWYS